MAGPVVDLVVERNQRLVATDANMRTRTRTTSAPPFLLHATLPSPPPPFDAQGRWSGSNRCSRKVARRVWYGGHCPLPPPPSFLFSLVVCPILGSCSRHANFHTC